MRQFRSCIDYDRFLVPQTVDAAILIGELVRVSTAVTAVEYTWYQYMIYILLCRTGIVSPDLYGRIQAVLL